MADIWRIYHVRNCSHTVPPKDKFVVIACRDRSFMGFLINTAIAQFILKQPSLLASQVAIRASDYMCLSHDSYLDCSRLYPFEDDDLMAGRTLITDVTKAEIKTVVSASKTIEKSTNCGQFPR